MSVVAPIGDIQNYTLSCKGPKKTNFIRIYASGGLTTWTTSSRSVQYFLPPFKYVCWDRSSMEDLLTVDTPAAGQYPVYNSAVNNRWLSARMQLGSTEVMNISNLNNGYSRAVRDPCSTIERFYGANSVSTEDSTGKIGEPCPSRPYAGLYQLLQSIAAAPTIAQAVLESPYAPSYYLTGAGGAINVGFSHCGSPNIPAEAFIGVDNLTVLPLSDKFANYPGTILSCSVAIPTGSGGVLELVQDSVEKSFSNTAVVGAGAYNTLLTAVQNTAVVAWASTVTTNQFLSLCVLANDGINNAEAEYAAMLGSGVEVELPWCDQINQAVTGAGAFSTNVTLPTANRRVKYISSALVIPGTNNRNTQCNGAFNGNQNLTSARAFINSIPDTNDTLNIADGTLHQWMYANSLAGGPLGDSAAFTAHPIYISNLTGMPLPELQKPQNQGLELGVVFDGQVTYQIQGTQADAVNRTCQTYVVSGRKAVVSPAGVVMRS